MVPFSLLRRTLTWPLCCLAISFTSASPSPAPPIARLRDLSTRKNGEKIFSWFSGEMPIPVSVTSIIIYRPFCKYICPLGAFYSIFNKVSVFRYRIDHDKCIHCGKSKQPGMHSLWKMQKSLPGSGNPVWGETLLKLYPNGTVFILINEIIPVRDFFV